MHGYKFFKCPESNPALFVQLFCFALLSSLILISNPGFYNHDELISIDYVTRHGLFDFWEKFASLRSAKQFEPIRPVGFFVEGLVVFITRGHPMLLHLFDVLLHGAVASALFVATERLLKNRQLAWVAALIFLINPLVTFSLAWHAAVMERMFILFGLVALIAAHSYIKGQSGMAALFSIFAASSLAILSKETAVILPGMLIVYPLFSLEPVRSKRLWAAFAGLSIPPLLFLLYRMQGLINSFSADSASPYSASLTDLPQRIFAYFIYPFLPSLTEANNWLLQSSASIWAAVAAHLALLVLLWRAYSYRAVLAYLSGYLIFLLPVISIPNIRAHYLYGSGLAFSLALGALLAMPRRDRRGAFTIIPLVLLLVVVVHALVNQQYFYKTGGCMNNAKISAESAYLANGRPEKMTVLVNHDAPGYVFHRFAFKRRMLGKHFPVEVEVVDWSKRGEVVAGYLFNCDCLVYALPQLNLAINDWGPQTTGIGIIPNLQPDGSAGLWIKVAGAEGADELQILFGGQPARLTAVQGDLITAAIAPEKFARAGGSEVAIKQVSTGKIFQVGKFEVEPAK